MEFDDHFFEIWIYAASLDSCKKLCSPCQLNKTLNKSKITVIDLDVLHLVGGRDSRSHLGAVVAATRKHEFVLELLAVMAEPVASSLVVNGLGKCD